VSDGQGATARSDDQGVRAGSDSQAGVARGEGDAARPTAPPPLLRVQSLCKRYGRRQALRDVSFCARPRELIAVIGPNGAGKTTLLSILAGVQRPSAGQLSRPRGELGWVPQQPALYSKLSVAENLRLFARLERVPDPDAAVARMLEQTGLQERSEERVERLSGGNRQRVNVALGLLADPPIVLLDEPSSALDPDQRQRLWTFVVELAARGTCVLFSTHIVSEAARYAGRVIVLDEGWLLFDGPPSALAGAAGGPGGNRGDEGRNDDFERSFVAFLHQRGGGG
jgi:ABC-2 type transport system ATP-binding protein